jgi:dihydrofolate synthase/folylpolyglutamate synthase
MRLFPALATNVPWGLERMTAALAEIGDPHLSYPTLHVAGTNGKGSVAATLASVLSAAGHRVGLYTSPHLCSFGERIQVGGAPLPEARLCEHADELRERITRHGLTFFEAATLLGFHAFARERVDVAVVEVGLGGRLDATNVVRPLVAAVTNVALDHAEYLGDTLPSIAAEKAAIAKPGVPLVTGETDPELIAVVARVCAEQGGELHVLEPTRVRNAQVARDGTSFALETGAWGTLELTVPLLGGHQASNAALAVAVLEQLPDRIRPSAEAVRSGVARVRWPGRNQLEQARGGGWLFDVAHNPAGVRSLTDLLDRLALPRPHVGLIGVLADKNWLQMLPPICARLDHVFLTQPPSAPSERRWDPAGAAAMLSPILAPRCNLNAVPDFGVALEAARDAAGPGTVIVTGSSHTVGDALRLLGRCPFGA